MSAYVLHDAQGAPKSIASGTAPTSVPDGLTAKIITDAEFTGLTTGTHRWNSASRLVELDTAKASLEANVASVRTFLVHAGPTLQAIIDTPDFTFGNVANAQVAVRALQDQVQDIARGLRRVRRMLIDDYTAAD